MQVGAKRAKTCNAMCTCILTELPFCAPSLAGWVRIAMQHNSGKRDSEEVFWSFCFSSFFFRGQEIRKWMSLTHAGLFFFSSFPSLCTFCYRRNFTKYSVWRQKKMKVCHESKKKKKKKHNIWPTSFCFRVLKQFFFLPPVRSVAGKTPFIDGNRPSERERERENTSWILPCSIVQKGVPNLFLFAYHFQPEESVWY